MHIKTICIRHYSKSLLFFLLEPNNHRILIRKNRNSIVIVNEMRLSLEVVFQS